MLFRVRARRRVIELEQQSASRCQLRVLLGMVHQAGATRFGHEHDFRRIHSVADYRRLVPVRTPAQFWANYWQPAYPDLSGVTWPGPLTYQRLEAPSPGEAASVFPMSPALVATHRSALFTGLALAARARPGEVFFPEQRPFAYRLADIWPQPRELLDGSLVSGPPWVQWEFCCDPAGFVAVEDPRHGLLRLVPDAGVYYEFIPLEQVGTQDPVRHGIAEIEPQVAYAVAMTSPAGLWACLTQHVICFEKREPPLLRILRITPQVGQSPAEESRPIGPVTPAHVFPARPPHPRRADIPAARRGMRDRMLS